MMCSGRDARLDAPVEKPPVDIYGWPMLDRIVVALRDSSVETIRVVTSPHTSNTRDRAADPGLNLIGIPDGGYVSDLGFTLARVSRPVVTIVFGPPFVAPEYVDTIVSAADGGAVIVCVLVELKHDLGANVDDAFVFDHERTAACPTELDVVGPTTTDATIDIDADADTHSTMYFSTDTRLALNVNRPTDIRLMENRCK